MLTKPTELAAMVLLFTIAMLSACDDDDRHEIYGFVDANGDWLILPRFDEVQLFTEGLAAAAEMDGPWGYIDSRGKWVIPPQYGEAQPFSEGLALVRAAKRSRWEELLADSAGERWSFVDANGTRLPTPYFAKAHSFSGGIAAVQAGESWGLISRTGSFVYAPSLQEIATCQDSRGMDVACFSGGLLAAKSGDLWGYLDPGGGWVIAPRFAKAGRFSQGLAPAAEKDGLVGYINARGEWIIPPRFTDALWFSSGRAIVHLSRASSSDAGQATSSSLPDLVLIDAEGKAISMLDPGDGPDEGRVTPAKLANWFDDRPDYFRDGLLHWRRGQHWGYIDRDARWAIEPQFDGADPFVRGMAVVRKKSRARGVEPQVGVIDLRGRWVIEPVPGEPFMLLDGRAGISMPDGTMRFVPGQLPPVPGPGVKLTMVPWGSIVAGSGSAIDAGFYPASVYAPHVWTLFDARGRKLASGQSESALPLSNAPRLRLRIGRDGLLGVADGRFRTLLVPRFHWLEPAMDGLLEVSVAGRKGCIDDTGRALLEIEFRDIATCRRGPVVAASSEGDWGVWQRGHGWVIAPDYEEVTELWAGTYQVKQSAVLRILKLPGKRGGPPVPLGRGFASVALSVGHSGDDEYRIVIKDGEPYATRDSDRYAILGPGTPVPDAFPYEQVDHIDVQMQSSAGPEPTSAFKVRKGGRWGVIGWSGEELLPIRYQAIGESNRAGIAVQQDGKWSVVDLRGKELFAGRRELLQPYSRRLVAFKVGELWGLAERDGRTVVEPSYESINQEGKVSIGDRRGLIDHDGRVLIEPQHQKLDRYSRTVWVAWNQGHALFIDIERGNSIAEHALADTPGTIAQGLSAAPFIVGSGAERTVKFGYLDARGKVVIEPRFDEVRDFHHGRAEVHLDGKCGFIDRSGRELIPPVHSHCLELQDRLIGGADLPYSDPGRTRRDSGANPGP